MAEVIDEPKLRGAKKVFKDREGAGRALSFHLEGYRGTKAVVLAIPSGGIPVAIEIARALELPLDTIVVRKMQVPGNPEAGFGAVGSGGNMIVNKDLATRLGLTEEDIRQAREKAFAAVRSRERIYHPGRQMHLMEGIVAILVDDGLASGYSMLAAVERVKKDRPKRVVVAVPTGSELAAQILAAEVDEVICLNIRAGPFAVADAYENWYDLTEQEASSMVKQAIGPGAVQYQ